MFTRADYRMPPLIQSVMQITLFNRLSESSWSYQTYAIQAGSTAVTHGSIRDEYKR